jgi:hypothetical protein
MGVVVAIATAAACALDIPDVIVEGGAADVDVPDVPVPQCDDSCAPAGFVPGLFALDRSTACPTGMQTLDLAADPGAAPASVCTCSCNVTSQPECIPATLTHHISQFVGPDGSVACNSGGTPFDVDGGCNLVGDGGQVAIHFGWEGDPFKPTSPGTCTSTASTNAGAVPSTASRLCIDTTCTAACASQGSLQACVYAKGDVPCPSGYSKTHHAGTVNVSCSPCSACSVTTDGGCEGTLALYSDTLCANKIIDVSFDGGCASTGTANGQLASSMKYTPVAVGVGCSAGAANASPVSLTDEITVCCP